VHRDVILFEFVYEQDFDQVAYLSANCWSLCALEIRLRCVLGEGTVGISPIESFQPFSTVLCISRELGSGGKIKRNLFRKVSVRDARVHSAASYVLPANYPIPLEHSPIRPPLRQCNTVLHCH
jgi:hypothetical protein